MQKTMGNSHFFTFDYFKAEFFSRFGFRESQSLDLAGGFQENLTVRIIFGQLQDIATPVPGQFSRQDQGLLANRVDGRTQAVQVMFDVSPFLVSYFLAILSPCEFYRASNPAAHCISEIISG